ncbi:hypothetical protein ES703_46256 [subsurface metagenome]
MNTLSEKSKQVKPERKYPKNQILTWMIRMRESGLLRSMPKSYLTIFFVLYSYRNPAGYAFPLLKTLVEKSGYSDKTVRRVLKIGKACLGIKIEKQGRKNRYFLPVNEQISNWQPSRKRKKQKRSPIDRYLPEKKKASRKKEKK